MDNSALEFDDQTRPLYFVRMATLALAPDSKDDAAVLREIGSSKRPWLQLFALLIIHTCRAVTVVGVIAAPITAYILTHPPETKTASAQSASRQ